RRRQRAEPPLRRVQRAQVVHHRRQRRRWRLHPGVLIHMFCPFCRAALPDEAKFCMGCGKTIPAVPASGGPDPGSPADARAPAPAGPVPGELPGWLRDQVAPSALPMEPESDPRSRVVAILVALLLVLLLIGGGLWLFGRSRSGPSVAMAPSSPVPTGPSEL